jgi:hypothetical protein
MNLQLHLWMWCTLGCGALMPVVFRAIHYTFDPQTFYSPLVYIFGTGELFLIATALGGNALERLVKCALSDRDEVPKHVFISCFGGNLLVVVVSSFSFAISPSVPSAQMADLSSALFLLAIAAAWVGVRTAKC